MKLIHTRAELVQLARELRVRVDWHEPDEQGVTAKVFGENFDNAGFWPLAEAYRHGDIKPDERSVEMYVVIYQDKSGGGYDRPEPVAVAAVNLATLLGWASSYPVEQIEMEAAEHRAASEPANPVLRTPWYEQSGF
jgi:hypothetical protein